MYKDELFRAIHDRDYFLIRALIMLGTRVDVTDDNGYTPIHIALLVDADINIIQLLITHGANVHAADPQGYLPIHIAAANTHNIGVIIALVDAGANINELHGVLTPLDHIVNDDMADELAADHGALLGEAILHNGGTVFSPIEFEDAAAPEPEHINCGPVGMCVESSVG